MVLARTKGLFREIPYSAISSSPKLAMPRQKSGPKFQLNKLDEMVETITAFPRGKNQSREWPQTEHLR
ncbi:hypothetical protein BGAL_0121g00160 [Botrytis galanthina]|uniref:Uncharacterized protein n=1 Tax=Botrytis galanthina TaxID=278940 RepID=A0A4S8R3A6_9HELO|nr:hypothetical protein BGAL_0121g00160 [Botrytis galanthina]